MLKDDNYHTKTLPHNALVNIDSKHMNMAAINRAWSNPKTTNEAAFFVIASRFGALNVVTKYADTKREGVKVFVNLVASKKDPTDVYFQLKKIGARNAPESFVPPKAMRTAMMYFNTPQSENIPVMEAVFSGDVDIQNLMAWRRDVGNFLAPMIRMLNTDILCAEPEKYENPLTGEIEIRDFDRTTDLRDFLFNLEHIGQEMPKFASIATHLDIPWHEYMGQVEDLKTQAGEILNANVGKEINLDAVESICRESGLLVDSLKGIEDVIGDKELHKLKPLLMRSVPKFIPPRADRMEWQSTPFSKHEFTDPDPKNLIPSVKLEWPED